MILQTFVDGLSSEFRYSFFLADLLYTARQKTALSVRSGAFAIQHHTRKINCDNSFFREGYLRMYVLLFSGSFNFHSAPEKLLCLFSLPPLPCNPTPDKQISCDIF
jgi:hypothetical protein